MLPKRMVLVTGVLIGTAGLLTALVVGFFSSQGSGSHQLWHERGVARIDQSANGQITFFGSVVDQDGRPIKSAYVRAVIHSINPDWLNAEGGSSQRSKRDEVIVYTNEQGTFKIPAFGNMLQVVEVQHVGHRWLYDLNMGHTKSHPLGDGRGFGFWAHGKAGPYLPIPESPAVFVVVHHASKEVKVAPSPGGAKLPVQTFSGPNDPVPLAPVWPREPSLPDIVRATNNLQAR